jgi:diamine N-acetyltransferase
MISFKLATNEDSAAILQMMEEFYAIDNYPFNKDRNRRNLEKLFSDDNLGRLWIVSSVLVSTDRKNKVDSGDTAHGSESTVVGYICATFGFSFEYGGRDAFIDEFFIKPNFRNQSIGRQAMEFVEQELTKLGIEAVHLEVERHNENGNRLYTKQGYKDKGRFLLTKWT